MQPRARIGSYELLLPLAHGGMGTVHVARRVGAAGFQRLVAIKRIHPHLAGEREFRAMMIDEARLSAAIRHPNVVPALDVVEEGDELALVLEYCEGASLAQLAGTASHSSPLPPPVVARILSDALAGLHAAHEAKDIQGRTLDIVHRDVSPQNVLVGSDGTSRLIDFGVAKAAERISVTRTGVLKGKLRYMSPEQARHKPLDRRSDVFSAGAVLYEALCGRPPFRGDTEASILLELLAGEVAAPTTPGGDAFDPAVESILSRALAATPEDRFATAADFQKALAQAIAPASHEEVAQVVAMREGPRIEQLRHDVAQAVAVEGAAPEGGQEPDGAKRKGEAPFTRPTRRVLRAGIAVGAVTVACAAAVVVVNGRRGDQAAAAGAVSVVESVPPPSAPIEESSAPPPEASIASTAASTGAPDAGRPAAGRRHSSPAPKPVLHGNPYP